MGKYVKATSARMGGFHLTLDSLGTNVEIPFHVPNPSYWSIVAGYELLKGLHDHVGPSVSLRRSAAVSLDESRRGNTEEFRTSAESRTPASWIYLKHAATII